MAETGTSRFRVTRLEDPAAEPVLGGTMANPSWVMLAMRTPESRQMGIEFMRAVALSTGAAEKLGIGRGMVAAICDGYAVIEPFDEAIALLKG